MNSRWLALLGAFAFLSLTLTAETVKDREAAVRQDRDTMSNDARWIYNDIQRGFDEAKRTGKPLLVVLRCVPCLACRGIDATILSKAELAPLLDQFVCVRVINANALDLAKFQFDYDLSFSTLFFNGDGTIYGRFGSWVHQKNSQDTDTAGFTTALESTLAIHRGYPANKPGLAGKQGGPTPFKTPIEIPALAGKYQRELNWQGKVVASCVHCHQIGDAFRASYRDQGKPIPAEWIYPQPATETVGFTLAASRPTLVEAVAAGSAAAKAGLQVGDEIVSFAGQPLISIADARWVLHRAPDAAKLSLVVKRNRQDQRLTLALPTGWRQHAMISDRVGTWPMRGMASGGMILEDLANEERAKLGLNQDGLALFVKGLGQYGKHAAAKNAGFQKGDVLVSIDGTTSRITEGELIGQLLQKHPPGNKVKATVLRDAKRIELLLPIQ